MPRVDKWLDPQVQKHKRAAEFLEEGLSRKNPARTSGRRAWALDERGGANRKNAGRRGERGMS